MVVLRVLAFLLIGGCSTVNTTSDTNVDAAVKDSIASTTDIKTNTTDLNNRHCFRPPENPLPPAPDCSFFGRVTGEPVVYEVENEARISFVVDSPDGPGVGLAPRIVTIRGRDCEVVTDVEAQFPFYPVRGGHIAYHNGTIYSIVTGTGARATIAGFKQREIIGPSTPHWCWCSWESAGGNITIADLDQDGTSEIIAGNQAYSLELKSLWQDFDTKTDGIPVSGSISSVSNVLDVPGLEVLIGEEIISHNGNILTLSKETRSGYAVKFGSNIALVHENGLSIYTIKGTSIFDVEGVGGGPVAVTDLDGDGVSDIALHLDGKILVFNKTAKNLFSETSTHRGAPTAFDFDNDSVNDLAFYDGKLLRLVSVLNGEIDSFEKSPKEGFSGPVIADVDNDGHAEIIALDVEGIHVIHGPWSWARPVWDQYGYGVIGYRDQLGEGCEE